MALSVIQTLNIAPQPWRNGGGATRELLAWPSAAQWQVRISLADIDRDGAFSQFTGVQRWFGVVNGSGVVLDFDGRQVVQTIASDALQFDGALSPHCRLLNGPTQDMNLMLRAADARHAAMDNVVSGQVWSNAMPLRALFTTTAGVWTDGLQSKRLDAFDFLYNVDVGAAAWRFDADTTTDASTQGSWWLGANMQDNKDLV